MPRYAHWRKPALHTQAAADLNGRASAGGTVAARRRMVGLAVAGYARTGRIVKL